MSQIREIQILSAPSILGLKPTGVEKLPEILLSKGLFEKLKCRKPVRPIPSLNSQYSLERDKESNCLNPAAIRDFSLMLNKEIAEVLELDDFPMVLGGDCSILIGILPALKAKGNYGLIFCDAHADFYQPEKSITGEVADMDLALVTGRGPDILTNIHHQKPYVVDKNVIHIGQRDWEETKKYGSQDIRETEIKCLDFETIKNTGISVSIQKTLQLMNAMNVEGFWLHFDTDSLADEDNPAVDYRLPGGLPILECGQLLRSLLSSGDIVGLSVTIFNPALDNLEGSIAEKLTVMITRSFQDIISPEGAIGTGPRQV